MYILLVWISAWIQNNGYVITEYFYYMLYKAVVCYILSYFNIFRIIFFILYKTIYVHFNAQWVINGNILWVLKLDNFLYKIQNDCFNVLCYKCVLWICYEIVGHSSITLCYIRIASEGKPRNSVWNWPTKYVYHKEKLSFTLILEIQISNLKIFRTYIVWNNYLKNKWIVIYRYLNTNQILLASIIQIQKWSLFRQVVFHLCLKIKRIATCFQL